jgi:hypothetical protein
MTLSDCVVNDAIMLTFDLTSKRAYLARLRLYVALQERLERSFTDKTNPGTALSGIIRQPGALGQRSDLGFC